MKMKTIIASMLLILGAVTADASTYGVTNLECSASVFWGDGTLTVTNDIGTDLAMATASYTDPGYFAGTALSTAEYGRVRVSLTVGSMPPIYSQQACRASARFTDTFAASGPIGSGTLVFSSEEFTDITTTTLLEGQSNTAYSSNSMVVIHAGLTNAPIAITFGTPFTLRYGIEAQAGFEGTNHNVLQVQFEHIRKLVAMNFFSAAGSNITDQVTVVSESGVVYPKGPSIHIVSGDTNVTTWWHSVSNVNYSIAEASSLSDGTWSQVVLNVTGSGSTNHVSMPTGDAESRFYRIEIE